MAKTSSVSLRNLLISVLVIVINASPDSDKIVDLPGYPSSFHNRIFSGYLKTSSENRKLHYVFIESYKGQNNTDPITLWMNGGPGCSSKIGLLNEIAPFLLPIDRNYTSGQSLTPNPYSWLNLTNLLFIDGPVGVGFSPNNDPAFEYNDKNTAQDSLNALLDFFSEEKFPEYKKSEFYLTGESYAGKYIPDLGVLIESHNVIDSKNAINLKGVLIGNPGLYYKDGSLEDSEVEFMIHRHFIDPKLIPTWQSACQQDPLSAGCRFFYSRYVDLVSKIDAYNIYGPCLQSESVTESQSIFMRKIARRQTKYLPKGTTEHIWPFIAGDFTECGNRKGLEDYFNINKATFKADASVKFSACNHTIFSQYEISKGGSISELQSLIGTGMKVYLFSGDWDDVIPFTDTVKNIKRMGLVQDGLSTPWKRVSGDEEQHIGFMRSYTKKNFKFFIVKGAGHMVPSYQPETTYALFEKFLHD